MLRCRDRVDKAFERLFELNLTIPPNVSTNDMLLVLAIPFSTVHYPIKRDAIDG